MMNNKGQIAIMAFMIGVVIIILAMAFVKPVNEMTTNAMNETSEIGGMNCTTTSDDFVKAACWTADIGQAYFILGIVALAGVVAASKIIFGGS